MNAIRERLLDAAARVYAETGYRGATTRRIAQEAGVNEITLFRHFGSKTTLILEAVRQANLRSDCPAVPASPGDPTTEIRTWVHEELAHLTQLRSIIRTSLGEVEERPEILPLIGEKPREVILGLSSYVEQLQRDGRASPDIDARTAALSFFGTLFADAMGRDVMPDLYHDSLEASADRYTTLFLRAIGAVEGSNAAARSARAKGQGPRAGPGVSRWSDTRDPPHGPWPSAPDPLSNTTMLNTKTLTIVAALALSSAPLDAQQAAAGGRPLSLADALRIAETASEEVGIARAATDRAAGDQLRARSERFPQIFASLGYTRTLASQFEDIADNAPPRNPQALDPIDDNPNDAFPATCFNYLNPSGTTTERLSGLENAARCTSGGFDFSALPFGQRNNWTLGLDVQQTLFAGGRVNAQTRMAGAGRRIAETSLASTRAQLVLNVIEAYYDAALADRLVSIAVSTLEQAETTLRHTQLARQVGNQPEFELLRATVSRDNQRPILIQRQSDRDIALMRLKQLLNLPLSEPLSLTTPLDDTTAVIPSRLTSASLTPRDSVAPSERAPVRQAADAVEVSASALRIARAQRLPQVNVNMQYGRVAYPQAGLPVWNDFSTNWTVGVALQVPLFTGGRITGDVRMAQADLEEARYRLTQARELSELDSYAAMARLEAAEASFAASAGTAQQAARAYQIAEIRYREGISTQVELSDSRILLEQASANRALASRDLAVARARVALLRDLPFGAVGVPSSGVPAAPQQAQQQRPSAPQRSQQAAALTGSQPGAFAP